LLLSDCDGEKKKTEEEEKEIIEKHILEDIRGHERSFALS
jgi:hypothetical protein